MQNAPRSLRHRLSGDNLETVVADQESYERCFFTYLQKLFGDLIDLRIRARLKVLQTNSN